MPSGCFSMRIAYLDCFSGISGDMFLGALVDAGVSPELFKNTIKALDIGASLEISKVTRNGIAATKVDVYAHGEKDLPREVYWQQRAEKHNHPHRHHDAETVVALAEHNFGPHHTPEKHSQDHGRCLSQIREIIGNAAISATAKQAAIAIFEALGEAEAKIHDTDLEKVRFHEVGAVDAMVDITCAAVGAEALGADELICSPLNIGGGVVNCAHGTLPVPAPATLELLKNAPVYSSGVQAELVTPTGAAIVKVLTKRFAPFPAMVTKQIGYGAGSREFEEHPNLLRLTLGESQPEFSASVDQETITVLQANLDDLSPQVFGYVMDRLLENGALDVFSIPAQMKKNRPGTLLTVLCNPQDGPKLKQIIFAETTTLGIRQREERRDVLARQWATVATEWGDVRVKTGQLNGSVTNCAPEYEDCKRIAIEHNIPLKTVMQEVLRKHANNER